MQNEFIKDLQKRLAILFNLMDAYLSWTNFGTLQSPKLDTTTSLLITLLDILMLAILNLINVKQCNK